MLKQKVLLFIATFSLIPQENFAECCLPTQIIFESFEKSCDEYGESSSSLSSANLKICQISQCDSNESLGKNEENCNEINCSFRECICRGCNVHYKRLVLFKKIYKSEIKCAKWNNLNYETADGTLCN